MNASAIAMSGDQGLTATTSSGGTISLRLADPSHYTIMVATRDVNIEVIWPVADTTAKVVESGEHARVAFACGERGTFVVEIGMAQAWSIVGYVQASKGFAREIPEEVAAPAPAMVPVRRPRKLAIAAILLLGVIAFFEAKWSLSGAAQEEAARSWVRANRPEAEIAIFGMRPSDQMQREPAASVETSPFAAPAVSSAPPGPSAPAPGSAWSRPLPGRG